MDIATMFRSEIDSHTHIHFPEHTFTDSVTTQYLNCCSRPCIDLLSDSYLNIER